MKKIILKVCFGLIIAVSASISLFILYLVANQKNDKMVIKKQIEFQDATMMCRMNGLQKYVNESKMVQTPFLFSIKGKEIPISFIQKSERRVFFIPEKVCGSCRDIALLYVIEQDILNKQGDIIVLFENANERELQFIKQKFDIPDKFLFYTKGNIKLDTGEYPGVFSLDKQNKVKNYMTAEKHNLFLLNDYLLFTKLN